MTDWSFETFSLGHEPAQLGESPCWDPVRDAIWWVDVEGRRLLRTAAASRHTQSWHTPERVGFVVLLAPDAPAVGMETGIFSFTPGTGRFERLVRFEVPGARFNDAAVDSRGRLWASTMALDGQSGRAEIHLVNSGLQLEAIVRDLAVPNGIAVDTDRGRLFYSDSHRDVQRIWTMPIEGGAARPGAGQLFASTVSLRGRPDGAALGADGRYWIAGVDGAALYVFGPDGALDATIEVPFPEPTKLCFFGPGGRQVAVTSKGRGEGGGYLARARVPHGISAGVVQPYWRPGAA